MSLVMLPIGISPLEQSLDDTDSHFEVSSQSSVE